METFLQKIYLPILDTLFPKKCMSCKKEGGWLCEPCFSKIRLKDEQLCPACEKMITPNGSVCHACRRKNALDGMLVATSYKDPFIAEMVHFFKYKFISDLHINLGDLLIKAILRNELPVPDMIIPVPLHPRRLRWHGFNQSSLLGKHISEKLLAHARIDFSEDILRRIRYTSPQMEIKNFSKRKQNIRNAFSVQDGNAAKGRTILLIDDIATTGSTIFECARVLKEAGAKEVYAVVVARQETRKN